LYLGSPGQINNVQTPVGDPTLLREGPCFESSRAYENVQAFPGILATPAFSLQSILWFNNPLVPAATTHGIEASG
jgi:hypothetical protein